MNWEIALINTARTASYEINYQLTHCFDPYQLKGILKNHISRMKEIEAETDLTIFELEHMQEGSVDE